MVVVVVLMEVAFSSHMGIMGGLMIIPSARVVCVCVCVCGD